MQGSILSSSSSSSSSLSVLVFTFLNGGSEGLFIIFYGARDSSLILDSKKYIRMGWMKLSRKDKRWKRVNIAAYDSMFDCCLLSLPSYL